MQLWTFTRYAKPRLCIDAIEPEEDGRILALTSGGATYRLAFDDPGAAAQTAADFGALRDPASPLWATLRSSDPDAPWHRLGSFLDQHAMIAEGRDDAEASLRRQDEAVRNWVKGTATAVLERSTDGGASRLAETLAAERADRDRTNPYDAQAQPDFFKGLLAIEFDYLRTSSPLALAAVEAMLAAVATGRVDDPLPPAALHALDEAAGLYDERDLGAHLWLVGECLLRAGTEGAARFALPGLPDPATRSGLEFMRGAEIATRQALSLWGENPYVTAIQGLDRPDAPLVAGPYIEQYHVTRRFVEIISPLLSLRLARPLRALMFQYYAEEVGHEELESTTCEALGVTPRALDLAVPLPLHFAFVDVLTQVARIDPIASFASVMVIEGVFGEAPRMALRLEAVGAINPEANRAAGEHETLNESLNHNSIARDCFEHLTAISAARQIAALHRILFLLELNHRAWGGITDFYGPQRALQLPGRFGTLLDPAS